ncbi:hypothetical protein V3C99_000201 [Haemonchus contortus]|uniref:HMG box domain containing protein n=1 Tax=Haemonchus contortus TaxID=6289 RepID=A0A7I4YGK8_HAECO
MRERHQASNGEGATNHRSHKKARLGFAKMNLGRDWAKGTEELKRAITEAWRTIDEEHLRNLVSSMPRRLFGVAL